MEITQELIEHCRQQRPILDTEGKFMFFSNNKVAQTSINRRALKARTIVFKDNNGNYEKRYNKVDRGVFGSIYKFTIVRNPWSRVVSGFFYLKKRRRNLMKLSFDDFVHNILSKTGTKFDPHFDHQYPKAFCNNECFLDFIGKIENLASDWKEIAKHIDAPDSLPHVNRSSHKPYHAYYTPGTVAAIQKLYQRDIEAFGYDFGG